MIHASVNVFFNENSGIGSENDSSFMPKHVRDLTGKVFVLNSRPPSHQTA
jgi:hypothetical protein